MKILVIGATGFTGKRVLSHLKSHADVTCLIRDENKRALIESHGFLWKIGDLRDPDLSSKLDGFEGLINIASLGFGDAPSLIRAAEKAGIRRALFVSTTAVETQLNAPSKKIRLEAERLIKESSLQWTLLRPTMIYGGPDDRNIYRFLKFLKRMPLIPVPGTGEFFQQPVFVEDLAWAIVHAFFSEKTIRKTYNISGKAPLSFNDMIHQACEALHISRKTLHFPVTPFLWGARLLESLFKKPFLKEEQILRLLEDKKFSHEEAHRDFGYSPKTFLEGVQREVSFSA